MSNLTLKTIDSEGNEMDGTVTLIPKRYHIFNKRYVTISQDTLRELIKDDLIPNASWKLFNYLLCFVGMNNKIPVTMAQIIKEYPHNKNAFYKAFRPLVAVGIFFVYKQDGNNKYYALNSNLGWKGKVKDYRVNDPEDPFFDLDNLDEVS